ncbi:GntR family transcriptional regulator [Mycolicibacterium rhodesiae]|uniref:GntR family transcriptional regulator n=1 Tax=Mycolicibacterium rhodesiae TaxID=36814 RepID=A0A1X0J2T7_MYCRH|nr:GntR family transcriptional regulator [Mycolicibacterium rhodesiae]MCV7344755.1 GntR family transcriptional regulator [Mycolicibacterium rhodesiae]ORB55783.1 GntR family transcriptional regulator [Mycolicibacterium rhodesiae]
MKPEPAYQVLRQRLRDEIAAGAYPDGVRLPTESELVAEHGLSRQTVRRAFQDLVAEGVVYRVPGRGTYANRGYLRQLGSIEDLMSLSEDTSMEVLQGLSRRIDVTAASRLRLDHDVVYTVVFRRLHDGVPFVVTTVHLPESVARLVFDSAELTTGAVGTNTVIGVLEPHLDQPIDEAAQSITVAPADDPVAKALGCELNHPMLRVDRLYSDTTGTPVELSVSHFLPEQYTYRVTLRRSS